MRFLFDHDVPDRIGGVAIEAGHAVVRLRDVLPAESKDAEVLRYARQNGLILVTCNRDDFLDLVRSDPHCGLVVLVRRKTRIAECSAFLRLIETAGEPGLRENITFA